MSTAGNEKDFTDGAGDRLEDGLAMLMRRLRKRKFGEEPIQEQKKKLEGWREIWASSCQVGEVRPGGEP